MKGQVTDNNEKMILRNQQRIDELERRIDTLNKTNTWHVVFNYVIIVWMWVIMAIIFWK